MKKILLLILLTGILAVLPTLSGIKYWNFHSLPENVMDQHTFTYTKVKKIPYMEFLKLSYNEHLVEPIASLFSSDMKLTVLKLAVKHEISRSDYVLAVADRSYILQRYLGDEKWSISYFSLQDPDTLQDSTRKDFLLWLSRL